MKHGTYAWGRAPDCISILQDVSLHVPKGALCVVVGAAGSGKTSLLAAMLGELTCMAGSVHMHGSVAYAAQVLRYYCTRVLQPEHSYTTSPLSPLPVELWK